MSRLELLLPGDPETPTGGYVYDRRMVDGLRALGWTVPVHTLDPSFPLPSASALRQADAVLAAIADGARVLIDGLALGAMPELVGRHRARLRLIALVHHPLALETGLDSERAKRLRASERAALTHVRRVIVTSTATARLLGDYGVDAEAVDVVEPGTDRAPLAPGPISDGPARTPRLLCVGSVTPRKGHLLLIDALSGLRHLDWMLTCAGSLARAPDTAAALRGAIDAAGLADRVRLLGEVGQDALSRLYAEADLFVLPSQFEGYGMAYAEALARGLPVLGTRAGAIPDTVPADAGLLVEPGSATALRAALERLLSEPDLRRRLAAGARRARRRLPDWALATRRLAAVLARV
jgi:glycosyltransferase involved in cell wall biosynthesis